MIWSQLIVNWTYWIYLFGSKNDCLKFMTVDMDVVCRMFIFCMHLDCKVFITFINNPRWRCSVDNCRRSYKVLAKMFTHFPHLSSKEGQEQSANPHLSFQENLIQLSEWHRWGLHHHVSSYLMHYPLQTRQKLQDLGIYLVKLLKQDKQIPTFGIHLPSIRTNMKDLGQMINCPDPSS